MGTACAIYCSFFLHSTNTHVSRYCRPGIPRAAVMSCTILSLEKVMVMFCFYATDSSRLCMIVLIRRAAVFSSSFRYTSLSPSLRTMARCLGVKKQVFYLSTRATVARAGDAGARSCSRVVLVCYLPNDNNDCILHSQFMDRLFKSGETAVV